MPSGPLQCCARPPPCPPLHRHSSKHTPALPSTDTDFEYFNLFKDVNRAVDYAGAAVLRNSPLAMGAGPLQRRGPIALTLRRLPPLQAT